MTADTAQSGQTEHENSDSNDTAESTERTDPFETLHPALRPVVTFVVRLFWVVGRLIVVGSAVAFSYLSERERRIHARRWLLLDGNRWAIVGGLVGSVFVVALVTGLTNVVGVAKPGFVTNLLDSARLSRNAV